MMVFENYNLLMITAMIVFFSISIQAMIGFGFALIATPLLLMTELSIEIIVVTTVITSACQRILFGFQMREHAQYKKYKNVIIAIFIGLPIGIYILGLASGGSKDLVKQIIGGLLLLTVIIQLTVKIKPTDSLPPFWGWITGLFSGILAGFANIGGPPLVIWVYAHNWTRDQLRAAPLLISLFMIPLQLILNYYKFGNTIFDGILIGGLMIPIALVGNQLGQKIGKKFNMKTLRIVVISALGIMGLVYIIHPILK